MAHILLAKKVLLFLMHCHCWGYSRVYHVKGHDGTLMLLHIVHSFRPVANAQSILLLNIWA
jgi:hypothetical protein